MSYKSIVLHLDDGARCAARTETAIGLAARFGSRLIGVAPTGLPDVVVSLNSAVPDSVECVALTIDSLRTQAEAVSRAFMQRCADARVGSYEARVVVEEPVDAVVRQGQCSDLVIVGQHDPGSAIDGVAADFAQQVFLHAGTPTLVVPHAGSFPSPGRCVLAAWKETAQAARAIRDALPLLRVAERVVLCAIAEHEDDDATPARFDPVCLWLATHGVRAELRREGPTTGIGDRLLSLAVDVGADLLVAGGYGHTRLREWALGGVTRHLLGHMTLPTLLSH